MIVLTRVEPAGPLPPDASGLSAGFRSEVTSIADPQPGSPACGVIFVVVNYSGRIQSQSREGSPLPPISTNLPIRDVCDPVSNEEKPDMARGTFEIDT